MPYLASALIRIHPVRQRRHADFVGKSSHIFGGEFRSRYQQFSVCYLRDDRRINYQLIVKIYRDGPVDVLAGYLGDSVPAFVGQSQLHHIPRAIINRRDRV